MNPVSDTQPKQTQPDENAQKPNQDKPESAQNGTSQVRVESPDQETLDRISFNFLRRY